ncbi:hypothetical protein RmaAA213_20280 [Rhodothermus marinus]|nr:GDP-mannose 4,6-dehydratase [Rhodothermus marinus]BBM70182.1 hypothetical protein RmaAA213_20280 [Rhodothermus marinus]BBM73169.1 hypothetical protein RmaAA338_20340 [Rhodothermus marinus]
MSRPPRTLITGGAGFIGSHLCERFLAEGHEVICMDNFITGSPDNIAHLIGHERFHFIHHDVTNFIYVEGPLDYVLHFASPASPADYLKYPIQTLKVGALGTHKALGLAKAKGARFLLASTSEVYGDPLVHPQPEDYWGNVNPVGLRGVYDEAKRFAEAMTMAYHRYHGVDVRIVRIFNSIMADETVVLFNDETMHVEAVEDYARSVEQERLVVPRRIYVPAFNPRTYRMELRLARAFIKHPSWNKDAYLIRTRYGRSIRVTGDHSVFRRGADGLPEAVPVRELKVGDYIAIPARLPVVEQDRTAINLAEHLIRTREAPELWRYALQAPSLRTVIARERAFILDVLLRSGRFQGSRSARNTASCAYRKYLKGAYLPLYVAAALWHAGKLTWPKDARIRLYTAGRSIALPNHIPITDDLLWLLGLFVAEGHAFARKGTYRIMISSEERLLDRAAHILETHLGIRPRRIAAQSERSPALYVDGRMLYELFHEVFQVAAPSRSLRLPAWILQLPLKRVKHFLEGYREGDGTHSRYPEVRELAFNTASEGLATDLTYLLLRFGIVASVGRYESTIKKRPGRRYPFWRVTVCELSNFNILEWDQGVTQRLNATRLGDLVWAKVLSIEPIKATPYVYDFSVEGYENFVAGNGVCAHNTYGPRMRLDDGRALPTFMTQALKGEPITVYGDGSQTRSFQYIDDLVEGIYRLLMSDYVGPVNIGNPEEISILEFAKEIIELTGSKSEIVFKPLPADDPKVRQPDISLARRVLGWEPKVSRREGLRRTLEYFKQRLGLTGS